MKSQSQKTVRIVVTLALIAITVALLYFGGAWLVRLVMQMHGIGG